MNQLIFYFDRAMKQKNKLKNKDCHDKKKVDCFVDRTIKNSAV